MYNVIIADDEFWVREEIKNTIDWDAMGLNIIGEAEDGKSAMDIISVLKPDILITDIRMPLVDGIELIKAIKRDHLRVQVIVISGYDEFDYVRNVMLFGAVDYLLKPIKQIDLINVLIKAVDKINCGINERINQINTRLKLSQAASVIYDRTLSQLISGQLDYTDNLFSGFNEIELNLNYPSYLLALIKITKIKFLLANQFQNDLNLIIYSVKNIIAEIFGDKIYVVFHNMNDTDEVVLIMNAENSEKTCSFGNLLVSIKQFLKVEINMGTSGVFNNLSAARKAYLKAKKCLDSRPFKYGSNIVFYDEISKNASTVGANFDIEKIFAHYIDASDEDGSLKVLGQLVLRDICHENTSVGNVRNNIHKLISVMNKKAEMLGTSLFEEYSSELEEIEASIESCDLDCLFSLLKTILSKVIYLSLKEKNFRNIKKTVDNIKEYIEQNYYSDLSLAIISRQFNIESTYLSKVFKQEAGENLVNFITRIRMEKAIEMMKNEKFKVSEIAGLIGYDDYVYFNKVFKKFTGKSPRDFYLSITK